MSFILQACEKTVADIIFLLDDSGSVTRPNFLKVKQFVVDIVRSLKIGYHNIRIGVVTFSTNPKVWLNLNSHYDKRRMINAINAIRYRRGGTNTHIALKKLRLWSFNKRYGDRKGVPNIAIVITDGMSSNSRLTISEAKRLQRSGVRMFSIGIGRNLRQSELIAMASRPTSEHQFRINNFAGLKSIKKEITMNTCKGKWIYIFENLAIR